MPNTLLCRHILHVMFKQCCDIGNIISPYLKIRKVGPREVKSSAEVKLGVKIQI